MPLSPSSTSTRSRPSEIVSGVDADQMISSGTYLIWHSFLSPSLTLMDLPSGYFCASGLIKDDPDHAHNMLR